MTWQILYRSLIWKVLWSGYTFGLIRLDDWDVNIGTIAGRMVGPIRLDGWEINIGTFLSNFYNNEIIWECIRHILCILQILLWVFCYVRVATTALRKYAPKCQRRPNIWPKKPICTNFGTWRDHDMLTQENGSDQIHVPGFVLGTCVFIKLNNTCLSPTELHGPTLSLSVSSATQSFCIYSIPFHFHRARKETERWVAFHKMERQKLCEEAKVDEKTVTYELEAAEVLAAMARCSSVSDLREERLQTESVCTHFCRRHRGSLLSHERAYRLYVYATARECVALFICQTTVLVLWFLI